MPIKRLSVFLSEHTKAESHLGRWLCENRIETIKQKTKEHAEKTGKPFFDISHDTHAKAKTSDAIIDHFATHADPSNNKEHTQWVMGQYRKQHVRQEDHPRIKQALTNFTTHKAKLANKDLNSYKRLTDVENAVKPHIAKDIAQKQSDNTIKHEGADLVHSDDNGLAVHHVKTKAAMKLFGDGTEWCTSRKDDDHNRFDDYNQDGKLYVIHSGEKKYHFHRESNQFMDVMDDPVPKEEFNGLLKKHPSLKHFQPIHPFMVEHGGHEVIDDLLAGKYHKPYKK